MAKRIAETHQSQMSPQQATRLQSVTRHHEHKDFHLHQQKKAKQMWTSRNRTDTETHMATID